MSLLRSRPVMNAASPAEPGQGAVVRLSVPPQAGLSNGSAPATVGQSIPLEPSEVTAYSP